MTLKEISTLPPGEALKQLDIFLLENPGNEKAFTLRGMKHWALGHRKEAIADYLAAIRINPDSPAREALKAANAILDFYSKDLLNP